jgi:hypothetical protein
VRERDRRIARRMQCDQRDVDLSVRRVIALVVLERGAVSLETLDSDVQN